MNNEEIKEINNISPNNISIKDKRLDKNNIENSRSNINTSNIDDNISKNNNMSITNNNINNINTNTCFSYFDKNRKNGNKENSQKNFCIQTQSNNKSLINKENKNYCILEFRKIIENKDESKKASKASKASKADFIMEIGPFLIDEPIFIGGGINKTLKFYTSSYEEMESKKSNDWINNVFYFLKKVKIMNFQ